MYNTNKRTDIIRNIDPTFNIYFINGPFVEITNSIYKKHKVRFINKSTNQVEHESEIGNNCWVRANKSYYVDWKIEIITDDSIYEYELDLKDQRVYIALDSKALGDTLAWFPYIEEFRKKHKCHVICSTFHNNLFQMYYPELEFIKPGEVANNIIAQYNIGWYYGENNKFNPYKNPNEFKNQPLQKTACDILGLEYKEIVPKITKYINFERENIVSIAIHGTAQAKYWNNKEGWQKVVDYLKSKGYRVVLLSREEDGYMGNNHPTGIEQLPPGVINGVIQTLQRSKAFIGIGSGLSWLSWATNTPTFLISGFSYPYTETKTNTYNITTPDGKCTGCFNTHQLDAGDWNWCPINKGTNKQFECSKSITAEMVIDTLELHL